MGRFIMFVFFGLLAGAWAPESCDARETVFLGIAGKDVGDWHLGLIDGKLRFYSSSARGDDAAGLPSIPADMGGLRVAFRWLRDGDTFQIVVDREQRDEAKAQAEKHHWYLTANYTEKGGEVTLTKEPTKYSYWKLRDRSAGHGSETPRYHVLNVNDLGKDAWLGMDDKGVRYRGRQELRKAILTFETKQNIVVEEGDTR
jgi:hypothetical protein